MSDEVRKEFEDKTAINKRVQSRYDKLMTLGKHGHYENMFKVVHEEIAHASQQSRIDALEAKLTEAYKQCVDLCENIANDEEFGEMYATGAGECCLQISKLLNNVTSK